MSKPLVVTVPHRHGKEEAKARIRDGLGQIRGQLAGFVSSVEDTWTEDRLNFRIRALGQLITGAIDVFEDEVRIEVDLPGVLGWLAGRLGGRIQKQAALLLEKPKS